MHKSVWGRDTMKFQKEQVLKHRWSYCNLTHFSRNVAREGATMSGQPLTHETVRTHIKAAASHAKFRREVSDPEHPDESDVACLAHHYSYELARYIADQENTSVDDAHNAIRSFNQATETIQT